LIALRAHAEEKVKRLVVGLPSNPSFMDKLSYNICRWVHQTMGLGGRQVQFGCALRMCSVCSWEESLAWDESSSTHAHVQMHMQKQTHTHAYANVCAHAHMHTLHTHAHTHTRPGSARA